MNRVLQVCHGCLIAWMVASALHLPVPLCDGDELRSGAAAAPATTEIDVDYVLLGCDPPADPDDGPFTPQSDENSETFGVFPTYLASRAPAPHGLFPSVQPDWSLLPLHPICESRPVSPPGDGGRFSLPSRTFAQISVAMLRC